MKGVELVVLHKQKQLIKPLKNILENLKILDKRNKIFVDETRIVIPTVVNADAFQIEQYQQNSEIIIEILRVCDATDILWISSNLNHIKLNFKGFTVQNDQGLEHINHKYGDDKNLLIQALNKFLRLHKIEVMNDEHQKLIECLPKRFSFYPPLLLINNNNTFNNKKWIQIFTRQRISLLRVFYEYLLGELNKSIKERLSHIALNMPIIADVSTDKGHNKEPDTTEDSSKNVKRIPVNLIKIYGDFGVEANNETIGYSVHHINELDGQKKLFWCKSKQFNVTQVWNPNFNMFSRGNIKEKQRILDDYQKNCGIEGKDVIDLYCGIGYFSLFYLKKKCSRIFCWDLNSWSIKSFEKSLLANKYSSDEYQLIDDIHCKLDKSKRIYLVNENNLCSFEIFKNNNVELDLGHINLGLLPTSSHSWKLAIQLIQYFNHFSDRVILHIHENISTQEIETFGGGLEEKLRVIYNEVMEAFQTDQSGKRAVAYDVRFLGLFKVKTYAPGVWHVVCDVGLFRIT
ncbi:tRNA(Phe) (4-demethylwyosine(37)-C(7)) aminocarboxypropyltransferase ASCRUDRAFT_75761 [Ascoidea rubescens DSM 1968]|uniref:tRNA(Phe) (4-demethylwyosine(37)-C(7)) aminocarboxypropyltransferase n=1 Tax=Ascoidea rubescens DSM 1968 TaxID=1344418 RepID=A0A1D2VHI7_9ASCO|nr:hypothetical protein ASCRUDRAFT_75761 [Ascoidea rubescens DSM 1968]ODV61020.1 hypothetical protein ASCRUDRAFT_75761 [Ascoidea rubescens DSM 1968]